MHLPVLHGSGAPQRIHLHGDQAAHRHTQSTAMIHFGFEIARNVLDDVGRRVFVEQLRRAYDR
jgi:hypothetical protein